MFVEIFFYFIIYYFLLLFVLINNDLILLGRSIWSFRHLELQNLSTGDDFIFRNGIIFLVTFFTTIEVQHYLKIILSDRAGQYGRLDTLNSKNCPLFQILYTETGWCGEKVRTRRSRRRSRWNGKHFYRRGCRICNVI